MLRSRVNLRTSNPPGKNSTYSELKITPFLTAIDAFRTEKTLFCHIIDSVQVGTLRFSLDEPAVCMLGPVDLPVLPDPGAACYAAINPMAASVANIGSTNSCRDAVATSSHSELSL